MVIDAVYIVFLINYKNPRVELLVLYIQLAHFATCFKGFGAL